MKNDVKKSSGLSFAEVLQLIFIVLKLCKVIDWKWVWVLCPTWITAIFVIILVIIFNITAGGRNG